MAIARYQAVAASTAVSASRIVTKAYWTRGKTGLY